ncbi:hypothetical protein EJ04DRAFT_399534, partial [Polyplosphaeria fusca]
FALSLLLTCRRVYSEAIEYLYTTYTFSISSIRTPHSAMVYLPMAMLPQRLRQIRELHLTLGYEYDVFTTAFQEKWHKTWSLINQMEGLKHLTLEIHAEERTDEKGEYFYDKRNGFLEHIKEVTGPETFVLTLPHWQ